MYSSFVRDSCLFLTRERTSYCVAQLAFDGTGIINQILKWFSQTISDQLDKALPALVCSTLDSVVDKNVTALLHVVNAGLVDLLKPPPPVPALPPGLPIVAWNQV